ncbi:MAG: hypothetical protein SVO01_01625 [Thermotogota bacterium]|nr:hypothetical protein [Thermotogota bacterium]
MAIIIFVFIRNNRIKLVIALGMISFIALILANPVIDIARSEARGYGGRFAIVDAFQDYYSGTSKTSIWYKFAQKTIPPATTYALYKTVEQKTFVGLATYPSILYDIVPRIVWPGKPIPLSVNGNFSGQAARIAASFFIPDTTTSWWTVGAGTMYWQFGTVGVLLGGLLVGGIWGCFTRITISCRSVFLWLLFFMVFYYGFYLFKGLDVVLYRLVKHGFYIFIFWAGAYTIGLAGLRRHPVDNQLET